MGILDYLYGPAQPTDAASGEEGKQGERGGGETNKLPNENGTSSAASLSTSKPKDNVSATITTTPQIIQPSTSIPNAPSDTKSNPNAPALSSRRSRQFSFRSLAFVYGPVKYKRAPSKEKDHDKKTQAAASLSKRYAKPARIPSSEKRARESALILRSIIVGPLSISPADSKSTKAISKPQLSKIKAQLMQPKSANEVIAQLRALPLADEAVNGKEQRGKRLAAQSLGPIHAVCLEWTEEEADRKHFDRYLTATGDGNREVVNERLTAQSFVTPSVATASIATLTDIFRDMQIVNLISTPDLGLGQPGDGQGILAGALPTAETVVKGVQQITPQLMALGYATSRTVLPDHTGIYPPTDRMSVLTYWWGLELVLPPPTIEYLSRAQSVSSTVINFLTALSVVNNGVREILPFVRYIAQFVDFEFNAIRSQDRGQGVVCAATWVMPAAMIPRPWDFPPQDSTASGSNEALPDSQTSFPPNQSSDNRNIFVPPTRIPASIPKVVITPPTSTNALVPSDVRIALRS